jgi:hypothetical protein
MNEQPLSNDTPQETSSSAAPGSNPLPGGTASPAGSYDPNTSGWERRMERRAERAQRREAARAHGWSGPWVGGAILIALGLIFLAQNLGVKVLDNWWALFILIPAIGSLATGWNLYQANSGQWTPAARGSLITGFVLLVVTAAFLFNLNWSWVLPVLLILAGVGVLASVLAK